MENSIPDSWTWSTLDEVCLKIQDGTHFSPKQQAASGRYKYVTAKNVRPGGLDLSDISYVDEDQHRAIYRRCDPRKGDVLLVKDGVNTGDAALNTLGEEFSLLSSVCLLRPNAAGLAGPFLRYFLLSPTGYRLLTGKMTGTAIKRIILRRIKETPTPVAPLPEQHRIVAEIEKHFTRLDAAVAALGRVRANLKRYRAAVLKAACEGRLVPTEAELARREGRTYEPADQLLARILKERRARWEADQVARMQAKGKVPKDDKWKGNYEEPTAPDVVDLPELSRGWVWVALGAIADVRLGKMLSPKAYSEGLMQLAYLRNENVRWGSVDLADVKTMGFKQSEIARYSLEPGDLLVCEGGEAGRCAVYAGSPAQFMYQKALHRVRPFARLVDPCFIQFCIQHYAASGSVVPRPSETTIQHLPLEKMVELPVPLPPLAEQHRIVAEVERRLSVIDELDAVVDANLKRAERLRQAILKRAFEGKLVPQDPNDEPASVLLERIRAERVAATASAQPADRRGHRKRRASSTLSSRARDRIPAERTEE